MKNMLKSLLVTALAISAAHVNAHTNKTFLNPRTQDVSLSSEQASFHDLMKTNHMDRFGGNFQVTGYYSESTNKNDLGKYFGVKEKSSFDSGMAANAKDLDLGLLMHDSRAFAGAAFAPLAAQAIKLQPVTRTYGVNFDYAQCLGKILDGLYLGVKLPVQKVENDMGLTVSGDFAAKVKSYFAGQNVLNAPNVAIGGNSQIFEAAVNATVDSNQAPLTNLKMNGKQSVTGIADIDVTLGYNFIRNEDWKAGLGIDLGIPTGNNVDGKNLFEPTYGSAHWSLGLNAHVCGTVWRGDNQKLSVHAKLAYAYGFKATEKRLVGVDNLDWSQYYLQGVTATNRNAQVFSPVANKAIINTNVTPGNSFRANLGASYHNGGLVFGLGYQPGWKDTESITFANPLQDGVAALLNSYGVALDGNDMLNTANVRTVLGRALLASDITADPAPSAVEHRIGANLGYTFKEWEYPVSLALGGHYGFAGNNAVAENWAISLSAGIGF